MNNNNNNNNILINKGHNIVFIYIFYLFIGINLHVLMKQIIVFINNGELGLYMTKFYLNN